MVVRYDAASRCTGGPTPGAIALRDHWRNVTSLGDMGIYNCRTTRGGSGYSVHAEGRAVDLAANAANPDQLVRADRFCRFLIDNSDALQCQYLIWNRRSWKSGRGWARYTGVSPHTDHIHAELNRDGARTVTYAQLNALWSAWTANSQGDDDLTPEESKMLRELHAELRSLRGATDSHYRDIIGAVEAMPAKIRSTVYTARDGLAKLIRELHG